MRNLRKYLSMFVLLGLFAGYLTCIFGFTHVHIIDGVRIVHSHPYSAGHEQQNHTASELVVLADISNYISTLPAVVNFDFKPELPVIGEQTQMIVQAHFSVYRLSSFLRGPPTL